MTDEIKSVVTDMAVAFEEFKKTYDAKLENVEAVKSDPLLDE